MGARYLQLGLALGVLVVAPGTLAQKMYKCPDGKGGMVFQQMPCSETADEVEARKKEKERAEADAKRRKEEEARKKQESIEKARERDRAYQEQVIEREREQKKNEATEKRMLEGTTKESGVDDGSLPSGFEKSHPGPWRDVPNPGITAAFARNRTPACTQYRYRQRANGLPEFVVQCTADKANWVTYFVWPKAGAVKGPARF